MLTEQGGAGVKGNRRSFVEMRGHRSAAQRIKRRQYHLQRGPYVRLHASQRTEAHVRELVLKLPHVMSPYCEAVDEIERTCAHRWFDAVELGAKLPLGRDPCSAEVLNAACGSLEPPGSRDIHLSPSTIDQRVGFILTAVCASRALG